MASGSDNQQTSMENTEPAPINSMALVVAYPSALNSVGQNSPIQNGMLIHGADSIIINSKKLQDDLQKLGEKIKCREDNVNFLKTQKYKLEDSILDMEVAIANDHTSYSKEENGFNLESEEETIQSILKYEKSAAALLCRMESEAQICDDVVGIVARLGKVNDANLSRLLSEYLGLETMLAVVCKSFEGSKALESYIRYGYTNKRLGIHALATVICLDNLRPYAGELVDDDPQRRLNLVKPRLISGETPPGFLGFAVNMITIDKSNLHCVSETGHSLRETLFYHLFSSLQVYRSRESMHDARPFITSCGAISLDGGMISHGLFSLGHRGYDVDVKFPCDSKQSDFPSNHYELENRLKRAKWKKERALEDLQREEQLLDHAKFRYELKKREFVGFLAESSAYINQVILATSLVY